MEDLKNIKLEPIDNTLMDAIVNSVAAEKADKKRIYMREYMKKWKAKKYADDAESIRRVNRTRYAKKIHLIPEDDKVKYGCYLGDILKLKALLIAIPSKYITEIVANY